jgi:hypothetical protein
MGALTTLDDTVATPCLIGRLPIGARHATKSRVISGLCAERESAKKPWLPRDVILDIMKNVYYQFQMVSGTIFDYIH